MENNKLIGSGSCPFCGKDNRVEVTEREMTGYEKWVRGEGNIQNVMPFLSVEKREILISGTCLKCQSSVFGGNDEEPDDEEPEYEFIPEFIPEAIEYELNKLGYILGREENEVVEYVDDEDGMVLLLDYALMRATKVVKGNEFNSENGNFEEIGDIEGLILRKHGFSISEEDEALEDDLPF